MGSRYAKQNILSAAAMFVMNPKDSTSQKFIDDYTGLGDWQNLLQRKHPKKNLRAWGAAENEFEFNLALFYTTQRTTV